MSTASLLPYLLMTVKATESEKSLLVTCKILRPFLNTLTPDNKYFLLNRGNLTQPIQMHLSQKQQIFSQVFIQFSKVTLNFKHFQIKLILIAYVCPKLRTPKDVVS